jgi:DNA replication protein DnaC
VAPVLDVHLKRAAQHTMSYQDFLAGVVREALNVRDQRRRERRLAACHFPFVKRMQDFEWEAQPTLNRAEVERLFSLQFIDAHDNAAFLGAPGLGKTMLAVALGVAAVEAGYSVRFSRLDEWALDAQAAEAVGALPHFLNEWRRPQLVILDEVGHHALSVPASRAFCQLLTRVLRRPWPAARTQTQPKVLAPVHPPTCRPPPHARLLLHRDQLTLQLPQNGAKLGSAPPDGLSTCVLVTVMVAAKPSI